MVKKNKYSKEEKLKQQARRYSIKEGVFTEGRFAFGDNYISPFAIAINASNSLVAFMSAIAGILGPISQVFGSRLIEKNSRKSLLLKSSLLEAITYIPLALIAILFYKGIFTGLLSSLLLLTFSLSVIFFSIGYPAWFSWMGDIVDEENRGKYFSKRKLILGVASIIFGISAAIFLDYTKKSGFVMFGFMTLFLLAFLCRLICWSIFKKQYEPKIKLKKGYYFSFWEFLKEAPKTNFGKFSIFRAFFAFATSIASPLVVIYLLRNLNLSYTMYMVIIFAEVLFSLIFIELWGKIADEYGSIRVLALTTVFIPIIPLLYLFSSSPAYLIIVPTFISGVAWAGFFIAASNFIYENVTPQKRGLGISYYSLLLGIGIFAGAGLGSILIKFVHTEFIEPIFLIFIISAIARMIVVFFGISTIKEIRKTKEFHGPKTFKRIFLKETKPAITEEINQIIHIKEYIDLK